MLFSKTLAVASMLATHGCATAEHVPALVSRQNINPGPVTGDTLIHDPSVVKGGGGYIAAFTGDGIQLKHSSDRTNWKNIGAAFPSGAPWTLPYTNGGKNLWAPDISFRNGQYYMYYSASTFGSSKSAIFLATSKSGLSGSWVNQGLVIESSPANGWNAIDPNLVVAGGWWLSFGSFGSGIKMISLSPSTGKRVGVALLSIASRPGGVEAPYIKASGGFYYLWVSFDRCCKGAASTYRIMVGRSQNVQGPYLDKAGKPMMQGGGTEMMSSHGSVHGPGHCAVFADGGGDVLVYHYYRDDGVAQLGINLIKYVGGWPVIY